MRAAVLNKARKYRWELWLLFGAPLMVDAVQLGTVRGLPSSDWTGVYHATWLISGYGMWLVLLGIPYRWVHSSGRKLLRLVWQYSLVVVPLGTAFTLVQFWVYGNRLERVGFEEGETDPFWTCLLWWAWRLAALSVLVWFARRASRNGFDKALVLIGVLAFPEIDFMAEYHWGNVTYGIGALVFKVLLSFVVMWALHSTDIGKTVGAKGIWALFGTVVLAYVSPFAAQDIEYSLAHGIPIFGHLYGWLYDIIPLALAYGITVLAAHLIRVRHPNGKFLPEGSASPSTSNCGGS